MQGAIWNRPTSMESPNGWKSMYINQERTYYLWQNEDKKSLLYPGESKYEFRISLPADDRKAATYFSDGMKSVQVDFKNMPFRVGLSGSYCLWGTIQVVDNLNE